MNRVVVNPRARKAIRAGYVEGLAKLGEEFLEQTRPDIPDRPPIGEGLVTEGAYGVFVDGERVAGTADLPRQTSREGVVLVAGYPSPMRFHEEGTIHEPARPVLTPVIHELTPRTPEIVAPAVRKQLARA